MIAATENDCDNVVNRQEEKKNVIIQHAYGYLKRILQL